MRCGIPGVLGGFFSFLRHRKPPGKNSPGLSREHLSAEAPLQALSDEALEDFVFASYTDYVPSGDPAS